MGIRCIIFDHTVVTSLSADDLRNLVSWIKEHGLCWAAFSTHPKDMDFMQLALLFDNNPLPDHVVTKDDIGKKKGSPEWIAELTKRTGLKPNEIVYVGDDKWDWLTSINSGIAYLHAGWSKEDPESEGISSAIVLRNTDDLKIFVEHFFLRSPLWSYRVDDKETKVHLRCLLDAKSTFFGDSSHFTLKDIFTYNNTGFTVGGTPAHQLLLLHTVSNLYLEGIISPGTYFCTYPSHKPGETNPILSDFLRFVVALFGRSYYRKDWLVRLVEAPDTSMLRYEGGRASIEDQANTVLLAKKSKKPLKKSPTVILFDDFTTDGFSFEWARNLLYSGGASRVILVALGKYKRTHKAHVPLVTISPFKEGKYTEENFRVHQLDLEHNPDVQVQLNKLFQEWKMKKPLIDLR